MGMVSVGSRQAPSTGLGNGFDPFAAWGPQVTKGHLGLQKTLALRNPGLLAARPQQLQVSIHLQMQGLSAAQMLVNVEVLFLLIFIVTLLVRAPGGQVRDSESPRALVSEFRRNLSATSGWEVDATE